MAHSTGSPASGKVTKPHKDFPLFPHATGRWAKKVRGKMHYFGQVSADTRGEQALKRWLAVKDYLLAGEEPPKDGDGDKLQLRELVNAFLREKTRLQESGEITRRTFAEYYATCDRVIEAFGRHRPVEFLKAEDFGRLRAKLAETRGPTTLANEITRVKMIFTFGVANGVIPAAPLYGQSFAKPKRKVLDKAEAERGAKDFTADEIRALLKASKDDIPLHAMILLGINCAYGQTDLSELPLDAVDLSGGWATFPRPKTGVPRRAKLWAETVDAIRAYLLQRPKPIDPADSGILFINVRGRRFVRAIEGDDPSKWARTDIIGAQFNRLLRERGMDGGRGFYALRHSHQTAAENSMDMPAVMHVMGHRDQSISARYRGTIPDVRLELVSKAVHDWLFPAPAAAAEGGAL